jgi:hypothetical protein
VGAAAPLLYWPDGKENDVENTASRLWKKLDREERLAAATHFWRQPHAELMAPALAAIVKARHLRPQVARSMPPEEQARALASLLDPGETVAAGLLVALHLGDRRALLTTFLDALALPHEDGVLKDEAGGGAVEPEAARAAVQALLAAHPRSHVEVYLNTLWLQDPERWEALPAALQAASSEDRPSLSTPSDSRGGSSSQ